MLVCVTCTEEHALVPGKNDVRVQVINILREAQSSPAGEHHSCEC